MRGNDPTIAAFRRFDEATAHSAIIAWKCKHCSEQGTSSYRFDDQCRLLAQSGQEPCAHLLHAFVTYLLLDKKLLECYNSTSADFPFS